MSLGNAPEDKLIIGMGIENPVLQHGYIGMGAFRDRLSPVEDGFVAAQTLGSLGCQDAGQQVQSFNIAVEEPGILLVIELLEL